jgi:hypothetical protein
MAVGAAGAAEMKKGPVDKRRALILDRNGVCRHGLLQ